MMAKNHDIIEIAGQIIHETDKAYLFTDGTMLKNSDGKSSASPKGQWIAKSQCEWDDKDKTMQMPEWLAMEKGFI